jgi:hypothetical protein
MSDSLNLNTILKKMKKYGITQLSVKEMEALEQYYREQALKKTNQNTEKDTRKHNKVNRKTAKIVDKDIFEIFSQLFEILPDKYHSLISKYRDRLEDEIDNYNESLLFGVEKDNTEKFEHMLLEDMFAELETNKSNTELMKATVVRCATERNLEFLVELLRTHEQNGLYKRVLLKAIARKLKLIEDSDSKLSIKEKLKKFNKIEIEHLLQSIKETGGDMFKISQLERVFHAIGDKEITVKQIGLPHLSYMFKRYLLKAGNSDAKTIFSVLKKLDKKTLKTLLNACTKDKKFVHALKLNQMTVIRMLQTYLGK